MYYYSYEASLFTDIKNLVLDEGYFNTSFIITIILSVLAFALCLYTAIAIRRARAMGVIVSVLQPIGLFATFMAVRVFSNIDFTCLALTATGSSKDDAVDKLSEMVAEVFIEQVFPQLITALFLTAVLGVVTILTIVYSGVLFGAKGKGFAIGAFIILVLRFVLIYPVDIFGISFGTASQTTQSILDFVFRVMYILPLILLASQGLTVLLANKKAKKAAPAVSPAETEEI